MDNKLFIIGVGPGDPRQLTQAAREVISSCRCVVAAARHRALAEKHDHVLPLAGFDETFGRIDAELKLGSVAVLVSGDPGVYSLLPLLKKRFAGRPLEVLPGISSLQSLCAAAGTSWIDAAILSGHGRDISDVLILDTVDQRPKTIFFCGPEKGPRWLCSLLARKGLNHVRITVGERLSYGDQRISSGSPVELAQKDYESLSLVLAENETPWEKPRGRPRDEDFIRGDVPMTRETVRSAVLDSLRLEEDSVLWDIGAGTGSVTVAAALFCSLGEVHAVERNPLALGLIKDNIRKFHLHNVHVYEGNAAEKIAELPLPTRVYIGGSGDELQRLLEFISRLGGGVRVVVPAVALKTLSKAAEILIGPSFSGFEALQVSVSRSKKVGNTLIMGAENPVTLFSAVTLRQGQ